MVAPRRAALWLACGICLAAAVMAQAQAPAPAPGSAPVIQESLLEEAAALLEFRAGLTNGEEVLADWDELMSVCNWKGVTCDDALAHVDALDLQRNRLQGPVDWESLSRLTALRALILGSGNNLTGTLPPSLQPTLEVLKLGGNQLGAGTQLAKWVQQVPLPQGLRVLLLGGNGLTGPLPADWELPPLLGWLALDTNSLTGSIPLDSWSIGLNMSDIDLQGNMLTGPLPGNSTPVLQILRLWVLPQRPPNPMPFCGQLPEGTPKYLSGPLGEPLDPTSLPACSTAGTSPPFQAPVASSAADKAALLQFRERLTNGATALPDWSDAKNVCTWTGIFCGPDGRVTGIVIQNANLEGQIAWGALSQLTSLERLDLSGRNLLTGGVSAAPASVPPSLRFLFAAGNLLSGPFPTQWPAGTRLNSISLEGNKLSGGLPMDTWVLPTNLSALRLNYNDLTGSIPATLSLPQPPTTPNGRFFNLLIAYNRLSGSLPANITITPSPDYLVTFSFQGNQLSGSIPEWPGLANKDLGWPLITTLPQLGAGLCGQVPEAPPIYLEETPLDGRLLDDKKDVSGTMLTDCVA